MLSEIAHRLVSRAENVFIPPEGAMQFEVLRGWRGEPVPERLCPLVFWVLPPVKAGAKRFKPDCPHKFGYPVIHDPIRPFGEEYGFQVCECVGRVIE